jgi:hypothetical protein
MCTVKRFFKSTVIFHIPHTRALFPTLLEQFKSHERCEDAWNLRKGLSIDVDNTNESITLSLIGKRAISHNATIHTTAHNTRNR